MRLRYVVVLSRAIEVEGRYMVSVLGPFKTVELASKCGLKVMQENIKVLDLTHTVEAMCAN